MVELSTMDDSTPTTTPAPPCSCLQLKVEMTPQLSRNKSSTYSSMLFVDIHINIFKYKGEELLQTESSVFKKIHIGKIVGI